jgi:hypothetical protein
MPCWRLLRNLVYQVHWLSLAQHGRYDPQGVVGHIAAALAHRVEDPRAISVRVAIASDRAMIPASVRCSWRRPWSAPTVCFR